MPGDLCRFDELGRFLFDRLCRELLAGAAGQWHESVLPLADGLDAPDLGVRLDGPAVVISAWIRHGDSTRLRARVENAIDDWFESSRSVLVVTNVEADRIEGVEAELLDGRALSRLVLSRPSLMLRLPSLLGICDEHAVLPAEARERSTGDVGGALELAKTFVPTHAYAAAVSVVSRFGFAVLTGPPEMGKTAAARMIGLAKLADGWELHECIRPEQLWERFDPERRQVFVADDAFGSTEYRPDAAERWAVDLDRALRSMDDRHWLLWTSRPAPLKAALRRIHREHGVERFPRPAAVEVDAAALDVEEKALMLFRHAKAARLPREAVTAVRVLGWSIVGHPHFTPERIRRFVADGSLLRHEPSELGPVIAAAIRAPTEAMTESFHALEPEQRAVLLALLDVPPGPVAERELSAAVRRLSGAGFARQPTAVLDRLTDHFVRVDETGAVGWVHPSWRDLVIDELVRDADARRDFLRACSLEGILLALSTAGGTGGRSLPFLLADADWDCVGDRLAALVPELDAPATTRLLASITEAMAAARSVELDALAAEVLGRLTRCWHGTLPVGQLERWLELRRLVRELPAVPDLTATWIELEPGETSSVAEVEEWLALVAVLREHDPGSLRRFGFPERQLPGLRAFLAHLRGGPEALGVLRRLGEVVPELADGTHRLYLQIAGTIEPEETFVPREIPVELEAILETAWTRPRPDHRLVWRVLGDL